MIVAPWSWEFTSGENPAYAHTAETCYFVGGTRESLTIPHLDLWHNPTKPSWSEPIERQQLPVEAQDPLGPQVRQFCRVIRGTEKPLVLGHESLETLKPGFPRWIGVRPASCTSFRGWAKILRQIRWPSPDGRDG